MVSKTTLLSLALAASTTAQSTVTKTLFLPPYADDSRPSITAIASNGETTTYTVSCTDNGFAFPSSLSFPSSLIPTAIPSNIESAFSDARGLLSSLDPEINSLISEGRSILQDITLRAAAPTAAPVLPRHILKPRQNDDEELDICVPYSIVQGPSTYKLVLTADFLSASVALNCNFGSGRIFEAAATCTGSGNIPGVTSFGGSEATETMSLADYTEYRQTVPVTIGTDRATGTNTGAGAQNTDSAAPRMDASMFGLAGAAGAAFLGAALAL